MKFLLKLLCVDLLLKKAFEEGFRMGRELDPGVIGAQEEKDFYARVGCWRSVDEAWANSESEDHV